MPSDDGPRGLRVPWLGWKGFTFGFEWSWQRWVVTAVAAFVTVPVVWQVATVLTNSWLFNGVAAALFGGLAAVWVGAKATGAISLDEPLAYKGRVLWEAVRTVCRVKPVAVRMRPVAPACNGLSAGAARSLGWSTGGGAE